MTIAIRPAQGQDVAAIDGLLRDVFPRADEADLVRLLCVDGDMVLVMVAVDEDSGALAGMVAFSRMEVDIAARSIVSVALAPVAVALRYRRQGVAEALIQAGIERLEAERVVLCFVLGEPAYYTRFGFHADYARQFASPYAGDQLMALPLQGGLMPCGARGAARHARAFARLSSDSPSG
ncbi:putative acetyltransferase [Sphingomonas sp. BE138]|uniref:GNAT family N-acetyltransferase n=1 Tax=Sphingomonas sp. BE138 TaxID=2817845 RepID=UPI00285B2CF8|nr:N-acetyltransferase [Sphingomonas sp. BE138]MDR6789791.1 putative acetyltransferase [Sphingomonas sp. BE138]